MEDKITYVNELSDGSLKKILFNGIEIGAIEKRGSGCWFGYFKGKAESIGSTKKEAVDKIVEMYKSSIQA